MGGNAFSSGSIDRQTFDRIRPQIESLLSELGVASFSYVGSALIDPVGPYGDIDIALQAQIPDDERDRLFLAARTVIGSANVAKFGQLISVNPLFSGVSQRIQLDLIPTTHLRCATWLMRGLFRHMLFALLAREESLRTSDADYKFKVTIVVPEGIQVVSNRFVVLKRTNDPKTILQTLGFDESVMPAHVMDLKSLAEVVARERPYLLEKYPEYVKDLNHKKGYVQALETVRDVLKHR